MRWLHATLFISAVLAAGAGCKSSSGLKEGETCHGSSECGTGLVCNFAETPPACRSMLAPIPDAATTPDGPTPDAKPAPDAKPGTPDAKPTPDAPPGTPDAKPTPDATPTPDAPPKPDAAPVIDAAPLPG